MKYKHVIKDGTRLGVLRPKDPEQALATAYTIQGIADPEEASRQFNEMLSHQNYTFMGLLGPDGRILDEKGWAIGRCAPGDSFVGEDDLSKFSKVDDE